MNIYKNCPARENDRYVLRLVNDGDLSDLLKVYGDIESVPFFNGDNCHGDDFHYMTAGRMQQAIDFWKQAYANGWFVRLSVIDKTENKAIGTVEEFCRVAQDFFTDCGLLRLDLRSDYERAEEIKNILSLIVMPSFELFGCDKVATKAIPRATERIKALTYFNFTKSSEPLIGDDGTRYYDYYVLNKK